MPSRLGRFTSTWPVGVLTAVALAACSSQSPTAQHPAPSAATAPVSITVSDTGPGTRLNAGFIGLGLEANTLALNEFTRTDLADYLRSLDPHGLLRIGGNSVESFWTSSSQRAPAWSHGEVTPASLTQLARVLAPTGWRVILGVPFKHSDPARAADEARYAKAILGSTLRAIEIGNEPNHYGIPEARYFPAFERFVVAIRRAAPGVSIAGPAMGRDAPRWVARFARDEAPHPDIALFTTHEYPLSICNGEHPTIAQLLSLRVEGHEVAAADSAVSAARELGVPAVIDETNSVVCWGAPGVSNVEASALWILDYGLTLAEHGVSAANFQTRIVGCTPYLPLCTRAHSSQLYARPEFYGLLALAGVGTGRFLSVADHASATLRVFALADGPRRLSVVLDDLGAQRTVTLHGPDGPYRAARETVLGTRSPQGLAATAQITWGGASVGPDGAMTRPISRPVSLTGTRVTVTLQAHSAAVLTLTRAMR